MTSRGFSKYKIAVSIDFLSTRYSVSDLQLTALWLYLARQLVSPDHQFINLYIMNKPSSDKSMVMYYYNQYSVITLW